MTRPEAVRARRRRLVGIAYGMLGTVDDAEDVVQDAYVRLGRVAPDAVIDPDALLTTIVTRLAIDRLRARTRERARYAGPWLPEPVAAGTDAAERIAEAERVGYALLAALERLNPVERAVLLLRDVFDLDYVEIAPVVGRSVANCRQIAVRARTRVGDPRVRRRPTAREAAALQRAFARAVRGGSLERLMRLLADDVVLWSDGGGRVPAARRPVRGARDVARLVLGVARKAPAGLRARPAVVNGQPAIRIDRGGCAVSLVVLEQRSGRIAHVSMLSNPAKLAVLGRPPRLATLRAALAATLPERRAPHAR